MYRRCFEHFGPLHWWPGDTAFEVCVGAILTQNTTWVNVEKAIANLKARRFLSLRGINEVEADLLAAAIRPAGYYNQKTKKLKAFTGHVMRRHGGSLRKFLRQPTMQLREELLGIHGIGPETADSIVLYAAEQAIFVVDAYTRRVLHRMGLTAENASYEELQELFHSRIPPDVALYNEFHAQIVFLGKDFCRKSKPRCDLCPVRLRR